jgi:phosphomevalonate kinase
VAASVHGGVLACTLSSGPDAPLSTTAHALPAGLVTSVLIATSSAATRDLVGRVRALRDRDRATYDGHLRAAAGSAAAAVSASDVPSFVAALDRQWDALAELGDASSSSGRGMRLLI